MSLYTAARANFRTALGWICFCFLLGPLLLLQGAPQEDNQPTQSFTMTDGVAEHRIGRRDVLRVTVWNGRTTSSESVRVAEDGTIFVPFGIDRILKVAGLSSTEVKRLIREESLKSFRDSVVQVVIEEYNANLAYLLGEIRGGRGDYGAGLYPLSGKKKILEFIIEHGGFSEEANMTKVQLNRADGEVLVLNMSEVIFQGDESQNVVVNPGDIVWVPSRELGANTYYVFGEVVRPGVVTTQDQLSLIEVISRTGSFTPDADRDSVYIARGDLDDPEILKMDLKRLVEKADFSQNLSLKANDIVFVPRRNLSKFNDVISAIAPLISLLRDTVFLLETRKR